MRAEHVVLAGSGDHPVTVALPTGAVEGQDVQLAIRPQSLSLSPPTRDDGPGTVPAKIADLTFLGNPIDCQVTLDDGTRGRVQVAPSATLEVGQRVRLRFDRHPCSVFPG